MAFVLCDVNIFTAPSAFSQRRRGLLGKERERTSTVYPAGWIHTEGQIMYEREKKWVNIWRIPQKEQHEVRDYVYKLSSLMKLYKTASAAMRFKATINDYSNY